MTVHGTNYVDVENNVTYNNIGHCFFLEDGIEHGNEFVHNLAIQTKCHPDAPCDPTNLAPFGSESGRQELRYDRPGRQGHPDPFRQHGVVFLDHQPGQHLRGQRGRGVRRDRFLVRLAGSIRRARSQATDLSKTTWPSRMPVREFKGNAAHSNFDGFMMDRDPRADGHFAVGGYIALSQSR